MTNVTQNFGDATQAIKAFKITAQALLDQGENAVSEHDPAGDIPYNILRDIAKTIPFSEAATTYGDMLETVPSPLAERIAALAIEHSKKFDNGGEQFVYQLYLADISERVPGFGDEILSAKELRDEVKDVLMEERLLPSSIVKIHEETELHLKDLSHDARVILADSIYDGINKVSKLTNPSPNLVSRLHSVLLTNIGLDQVDHAYGAATDALFDIAPFYTQCAILDEKINSVNGAADADEMIARDAILSRYGVSLEDFQRADATLKTADFFIPHPSGKGQTLPLAFDGN